MLQEYSPCNMTGCEHQLLRCCVNISNLKEFQGHGQTLSCIAYLCAPVRPMGIVPFSFCLPVPPTIGIANWYSEAQCPARVVAAALKSSQEIRTTFRCTCTSPGHLKRIQWLSSCRTSMSTSLRTFIVSRAPEPTRITVAVSASPSCVTASNTEPAPTLTALFISRNL